ncbi:MAG: hypothetical protein ACR2NU_15860 [Aeoliella sp.]
MAFSRRSTRAQYGRSRHLSVEALEDRWLLAVTAVLDANNDAVITGSAVADEVTMQILNQGLSTERLQITDPGTATAVFGFTQDSANVVSILTSNISGGDIFINTDDGDDTVQILSSRTGLLTTVDTDFGDDTTVIGETAANFNTGTGTLSSILGEIQVTDAGDAHLQIDASGDAASVYTLSSSQIVRPSVAIIGYSANISEFSLATGDGADSINIVDTGGIAFPGTINVDSNAGHDLIDAGEITSTTSLTLSGSSGDDTIIGGSGNDTINGGDGDDTIVDSPGADTYDGGSGFDTIIVMGMPGDDVIDVFQASNVLLQVDGTNNTLATVGGIPTSEEVRIEAGEGNDLIRVGHLDAFLDGNDATGTPAQMLRITVVGDAPNASDRLIVRDDAVGDLVLQRQAVDERSGRVTLNPTVNTGLGDIVYEQIERVDIFPIDGVTGTTGPNQDGRLVVFQDDPFEANDTRLIATDVSDLGTTFRNPTIDPGGVINPFGPGTTIPGDEDWYRFDAAKTGTFRFDAQFESIATVPSGRPGLPGNGELKVSVFDGAGNLVVHGQVVDPDNNANTPNNRASASFGALNGETYFLRVEGGTEATDDETAINSYHAELVEIDVLGPQVFDPDGNGPNQAIQVVTNGVVNTDFNLFGVKDGNGNNQGPTPVVNGLLINVRDLITRDILRRAPGSEIPALDQIVAQNVGHYSLIGDAVGVIPITSPAVVSNAPTMATTTVAVAINATTFSVANLNGAVVGDLIVFDNGPADGQVRVIQSVLGNLITVDAPFTAAPVAGNSLQILKIATATIQLNFPTSLPDDRYTLTLSDSVLDPAGNLFDGESDAAQPVGTPTFPSGDGVSGGDFIARFNVDSGAEIGTWSAGSVYLDANGNFTFDPQNPDSANRDIVHTLGFSADAIFAGNFANGAAANGFDKLAAYGIVGSQYRWLLDFTDDGVPDNVFTEPASFTSSGAGTPVAGNFDGNAANGDEIGWFNGDQWRFDTDRNFLVNNNPALTTPIFGLPFVGDFDGDGNDDVGTYNQVTNTFSVLLNPNFAAAGGTVTGAATQIFQISDGFPFIGVRDRPVSADFDGDNIDDVGLWVPDRSGVPPTEAAEWYIFVSGGTPIVTANGVGDRIVEDLTTGNNVIQFMPQPFGNDLFAQLGDDFAVPLVGNFDPPASVGGEPPAPQIVMEGDFGNDGTVGPEDFELWQSSFGAIVTPGSGTDGNGDGVINSADYTVWRNRLGASSGSQASLVLAGADNQEADPPAALSVATADLAFAGYITEPTTQPAARSGLRSSAATPVQADVSLLLDIVRQQEVDREDLVDGSLVSQKSHPDRDARWAALQSLGEGRDTLGGLNSSL